MEFDFLTSLYESVFSGTALAIGASGASYFFQKWQKEREELAFTRNIVDVFNERYNKLNNTLHKININHKGSTIEDLKRVDFESYVALNDYMNLCAEEKFWLSNSPGPVAQKVWKAWQSGMKWWYEELPVLKELWELERENAESYYLVDGEDLFDSSNTRIDSLKKMTLSSKEENRGKNHSKSQKVEH